MFTAAKLENNRLSYGDTSAFVKEITLLSDAWPHGQIVRLARGV